MSRFSNALIATSWLWIGCTDSEPKRITDAAGATPSLDAQVVDDARVPSADAGRVSCGSSDCSGHLWPRIIVVNQSGNLTTESWKVSLVTSSGSKLEAQRQSCPAYQGAPMFPCDFGFFANGAVEQSFAVEVIVPGTTLTESVSYKPGSCPAELLRVKVLAGADGGVQLAAPEQLNPCSAL